MTKPRIAVPTPTSTNFEYNRRCWPQYAHAIECSGGIAVEVPIDSAAASLSNLLSTCHGIVLPGSPADVDPMRYGQERTPECAPADPQREWIDQELLEDAYHHRKPVLGICFGVQFFNVWRGGTLVQDLTCLPVNHVAGGTVAVAHTASIAPESSLGRLADVAEVQEQGGFLRLPINSSHHQAIGVPGRGVTVVARCPEDAVIEAVSGGMDDKPGDSHFVLGVQWHPERSFERSATSRALFARLVSEAAAWQAACLQTVSS